MQALPAYNTVFKNQLLLGLRLCSKLAYSCACARAIFFAAIFGIFNLFVVADQAAAQNIPIEAEINEEETYQPLGIRVGSFLVHPGLRTGTIYDSNIFDRSVNVQDDVIHFIEPSLKLRSRYSRHEFNLDFLVRHLEYSDSGVDSFTGFDSTAQKIINVRYDFDIIFDVHASYLPERRTSTNADIPINAAEPVPLTKMAGIISLKKSFNAQKTFYALLSAGYENQNYDDIFALNGTRLDQDFRDNGVWTFQQSLHYTFVPWIKNFVTGTVNMKDFSDSALVTDRDATEWIIASGTELIFSPIWRAKFVSTYTREDFHHPAFGNAEWLPGYTGTLFWTPNALFNFEFNLGYTETGINFEEGGNASTNKTISAKMVYKPRRYLMLTTAINFENRDFSALSREEDEILYEVSLDYFMRRNLQFSLQYNYNSEEASDNVNEFDRHIVQSSVKFKF